MHFHIGRNEVNAKNILPTITLSQGKNMRTALYSQHPDLIPSNEQPHNSITEGDSLVSIINGGVNKRR